VVGIRVAIATLSDAMPPLPLLVFVVGTGSLGAEIAAVRLLAPYFGASTIVWANTIGIVLVALSLGYWLGGRLADRHPHMRGLCLLALSAAGLLALVPFVADPMLDIAVDALDQISAGAFLGSLIGVLVLVAIPVLLLGAVSPWAIRLAVSSVEEAGSVAGRLYALSTAGSLLGTLVSALVLIPLVGTRRTFLIFALAIALIAVAGLRPVRRWALAPTAIAVLIALPVGTLKADTEDGGRVIHEAETEYQYARVIEYPDGKRTLELNEGQAQHSVCQAECEPGPGGPRRPSSVLTGDVWDGHLVLQFAGRRQPPARVAILGNAAGTTARAYEEFFPRTRVDGVEIDGELSDIGREYFDMNNPRLHLYHEDARPFLRRVDAEYDVISVDAYRQPYIPFYLTTVEFFETVRDRLAPGGVLIVNAGHPEDQNDLEKVLTATISEVFPHVLRDPIEDTNTLIVASERKLSAQRLRDAVPRLPTGLQGTALAAAARIEEPLAGGDVYTDDKAPVEWLIDKSIVDYASGADD
jgi:predicted membrane-bound spermidine synthase